MAEHPFTEQLAELAPDASAFRKDIEVSLEVAGIRQVYGQRVIDLLDQQASPPLEQFRATRIEQENALDVWAESKKVEVVAWEAGQRAAGALASTIYREMKDMYEEAAEEWERRMKAIVQNELNSLADVLGTRQELIEELVIERDVKIEAARG